MDDFPKSTVAVRELSHGSSVNGSNPHAHANPPSPALSKTSSRSTRHSGEAPRSPPTTQKQETETYTSFPPPSNSTRITAFDPDAPPTYRKEDYEGKSQDEVRQMRKRDYAVEISRLMGRQLVKGMNGKGREK